MEHHESYLEKIKPIIQQYFQERSEETDQDNPSVPLARSPYGADEIIEGLESMMSTYVTMGDKVERFERRWSDYMGVEHGVMTNSGSSANLIAMKSAARNFSSRSEVIVPAVGWSTTVFPVIDSGAKPVFVDVDPESLRMDEEAVKSAVSERTEAIIPVHLLGNPAPMSSIKDLCIDNDLILLEDCCQAHGAEYRGQKVGTFGDFGTFSFSFSHHLTTTEGGMVVTDKTDYQRQMKMLRSWGRARDIEDAEKHVQNSTDIELDFLFTSHGYNVRPTEIQAAFGLHQLDKMDNFVRERRENAAYLDERLRSIDDIKILKEQQDSKCSYLHYPLILNPDSDYIREELRSHLEEHGIETRPFLSGNLVRHPVFKSGSCKSRGDLSGAETIHERGMYISCHPYMETRHLDHIVETIESFFYK